MKTKEIEFEIESDDLGTITLKYEFQIWRTKSIDRYIPRFTSGLLSVSIHDNDSEVDWEFGSGEDMPREMKIALKDHDAEISEMIDNKMFKIVNDPHYEGNHDADPRDEH
jgi:hypothetical protein